MLDVTGGGITKDIDTLSADGLDYGDPSYFADEEAQAPTGRFRIAHGAQPRCRLVAAALPGPTPCR